MSKSGDHFEEFSPHTRTKHAILRAYLGSWAMKLLQWGKAGRTVYFVDGFAGAGRDNAGNPGSPLIAARVAIETMAHLRSAGVTGARMRIVAIEKVSRRARQLSNYLSPLSSAHPGMIEVRSGELSDHIEAILATTGEAPTLYFLDPYGVKGLDADTYSKMLKGPHNEIFVLFADMGASRLHGLVTAERPDVEAQIRALRSQMTLLPEVRDLEMREDEAIRAKAATREAALDLSSPLSRGHITRALGDEVWLDELESAPASERPDVFLVLFMRRLIAAGAREVLTVPMRNEQGRRVYSLVHASKSATAFKAMKESVHTGLRRGELPASVCEMIRDDLREPLDLTVDLLEHVFAGQSLRWTLDKGDLGESVRGFVLANTPMFPFQLGELQSALVKKGYIECGKSGKPKRPIVVTFPPAPME